MRIKFNGQLPQFFGFRGSGNDSIGIVDMLGVAIVLIVLAAIIRGENPMALLRELAEILRMAIDHTAKGN
jgi:hypothetical protein